MNDPNSNALGHTRAAFLADIWAVLVTAFQNELRAHTITRQADRAFITNVANVLEALCQSWRNQAPRICEERHCERVVTNPHDVLCAQCKARIDSATRPRADSAFFHEGWR